MIVILQTQAKGVSLESFLRRNPETLDSDREVHVDMNITCFEHGGRRLFTALFRDIGYVWGFPLPHAPLPSAFTLHYPLVLLVICHCLALSGNLTASP